MAEFIYFLGEQWMLVSILIGLFYLLLFTERMKSGRAVSALQVAPLVNNEQGVIVDVRDSADFRAGHIVDAINIPFSKISERLPELDGYKDVPVILACKMGHNSTSVSKTLKKSGFTQVCRLEGGIDDWRASNMPLVKD